MFVWNTPTTLSLPLPRGCHLSGCLRLSATSVCSPGEGLIGPLGLGVGPSLSFNQQCILAPAYRVDQRVWLSIADLPLRLESRKLAPRFVGPFPVSKVVNTVAVQLRLPRPFRVHPIFHVSRVKPAVVSDLVPSSGTPPHARVIGCGNW